MKPVLVMLVALVGCSAPGASPPPSSDGGDIDGTWRLSSGHSATGELPLVEDHPVTLIVDGSQVGGTAACNSYGARLVTRGSHVAIVELGMTAMGCEAAVAAVEAAYVAALSHVTSIGLDGDALVLAGTDTELRFARLAAPPTAELVGTVWVLDSLFVGDVAGPPMGERATLELLADGTFTGSTGCRSFSGEWVERGNQIAAPIMSMDGSECPAELSDQDSHVVSVIGDGFVPTIEGGLLTLLDPGSIGLIYRADGG
jgi:heat shock protein HslJ